MSRKEFMARLEKLLMDIPTEERVEAMAFYHSYFEDAGEENEERVIRELESPEKVAASIKAEMNLEAGREEESRREAEEAAPNVAVPVKYEGTGREYTQSESGYTQAGNGYGQSENGYTQAGNGYGQSENGYTQADKGGKAKEDNTFKIVMIVIVAVLTCPIWLGLLGGLLGLLLGVLGGIFGIVVAAVAIAFSLYLAGFALVVTALVAFGGGAGAVGAVLLGAGLLVLAFALLSTVICVWLFGAFAPWAVRGIRSLCKRLVQRIRKGGCTV
ncbi:MAG: DUF1700 domain-containing protein [Lachnospiraceae bacterium]|nr:DUF1700 domain-containing protein [Lachnospiraceae bacterium]